MDSYPAGTISQINPSLPKSLWVVVFYHSNGKATNTIVNWQRKTQPQRVAPSRGPGRAELTIQEWGKLAESQWAAQHGCVRFCPWLWMWCDQLPHVPAPVASLHLQTRTWNCKPTQSLPPQVAVCNGICHSNRNQARRRRRRSRQRASSHNVREGLAVSINNSRQEVRSLV